MSPKRIAFRVPLRVLIMVSMGSIGFRVSGLRTK